MTTLTNPPAAVDHNVQLAALLEEYKTIKAEQGQRISLRDNLMYATILAALAAAGATPLAGHVVPLLLPPVCVVLGWTYLTNDVKISAMGRYLRDRLAPRLSALTGLDILQWETAHRADRRRRQRKLVQLLVDLGVFVVPAIVALLAYLLGQARQPWMTAAACAEALVTVLLTWQIVSYCDLASAKRPTRE